MRPQLDGEYLKTKRCRKICLLFHSKQPLRYRTFLLLLLCPWTPLLRFDRRDRYGSFYFEWPWHTDSQFISHRPNRNRHFQKWKIKGGSKWNEHPDVKHGGAGGALLERNTGSWHPKRQRAIVWHRGSGTGDWEDSYLQNRCLANFRFRRWCHRRHRDILHDSVASTQNSQLLK